MVSWLLCLRAYDKAIYHDGRVWQNKAAHLMMLGSRENRRGWGEDTVSKGMPPRTYSLRLDPNLYIFHHLSIVHSAMTPSKD